MASANGPYAMPTAATSATSAKIPVADTAYTGLGVAKGLYIGATGNVQVVMQDGTTALFINVQGGTILPIFHTMVTSTNTTATSLLALF